MAADVLFDPVERGDLFQPLIGDRRGAGSGDLMQLAPRVCPAVGQTDILLKAFRDKVGSQVYLETPTTYIGSERFDILS